MTYLYKRGLEKTSDGKLHQKAGEQEKRGKKIAPLESSGKQMTQRGATSECLFREVLGDEKRCLDITKRKSNEVETSERVF